MRKAEIRISAEKTTLRQKYCFLIYKAMAYRWEDKRTADPEIDSAEYFLTEEEAIKYADDLNVLITTKKGIVSILDLNKKEISLKKNFIYGNTLKIETTESCKIS